MRSQKCGQPCEASAARDGQRGLQHRPADSTEYVSQEQGGGRTESVQRLREHGVGLIEDKRGMMGKGDGKVPFSLWMVSLGKLWGTFE